MSIIPIVKKPYPDEFLYSWIHRLAKENGVSISRFSNLYLARNGKNPIPIEVRGGFEKLCDVLGVTESLNELYLSLSTFSFESLAMTKLQQTRIVNNVFQKQDDLNNRSNSLFSNLKICPECANEDSLLYRTPYFHRSHQLSGVYTCHKHHCMLEKYVGVKGHECDYNKNDYEIIKSEISIDALNAYTDYVQYIFDAMCTTDIEQMKGIFLRKLNDLGYCGDNNYSALFDDIGAWKYKDLFVKTPEYLMKRRILGVIRDTNMQELIPLLMFAFSDPKDLVCEIYSEALINVYKCENCDQIYYSTPQAVADGWGCPHCNRKLSTQERFIRLIDTIGNRQYIVKSNFESMTKKVLLYHQRCEQNFEIMPAKFLYEGIRCSCENIIIYKDAKKAIEAYKGFKLEEFQTSTLPVTIFHDDCKRTFSCGYHKFLKFPNCRCCKPSIITPEIFKKRVQDLVGDEYSIVKGYTTADEKIILKHNRCGLEQEYDPYYFYDGQRCKYCRTQISHNKIENLLIEYSDGKYVVAKRNRNNWDVKNTLTDETISLSPLRILQEIFRPTTSEVLPVEHKKIMKTPLSQWEEMFQLLLAYREEYGTINVNKTCRYKGRNLGHWCIRQRCQYKKGKLKSTRIQALRAIGFYLGEEHKGEFDTSC